jgi:hypothetical protein
MLTGTSDMSILSDMANEIVICTYRVNPEHETEFRSALERHWSTLHRLELVTDRPPQHYRSLDGDGVTYVEIFEWVDGGSDVAHEHPDVIEIWDLLEAACQVRNGRPATEFPHFEQLAIV